MAIHAQALSRGCKPLSDCQHAGMHHMLGLKPRHNKMVVGPRRLSIQPSTRSNACRPAPSDLRVQPKYWQRELQSTREFHGILVNAGMWHMLAVAWGMARLSLLATQLLDLARSWSALPAPSLSLWASLLCVPGGSSMMPKRIGAPRQADMCC